MKKLLMMLAALAGTFAYAELTITDVTAVQRYPWNGKVDITYSVEGDISTKAKEEGLITSLKVSAIDLTTSITNVANELSGDISLTEGTHKIVWDMNAQGLTFKSTNVVFNVACEAEPALYCIVDLSAGPNASSYPVSYTNEIPGGSWSDEYKTTKLALRRISAGIFTMGSPTDELGRDSDEIQHLVTLTKDYYVGVFQVTQRQWELVMGTRPSYFNNSACYVSRPVEQVSYNMIRGSSAGAGWPDSSDVDATSFLGVLRAKSAVAFDLPTEAQWEYACRAGTTTALNSGVNLTSTKLDSEMAKVGRYWWSGGSNHSQGCDLSAGTAKVGSYAPNAWGLYDMHGNVMEWCLDWPGSYSGDETNPKGSSSGSIRIIRGGSWNTLARDCRSGDRYAYDPSCGYGYFGVRLVRTMSDVAMAELATASGGASVYGVSSPVLIDLTTGARNAAWTEILTYSTNWVENVGADAIAEVAVDGVVISSESGSGMVLWTPTRNATHELTHTIKTNGVTIGQVLTATFIAEVIYPETPVVNPTSGTTFDTSLTISMTCASKYATIHYTTDGTTPTIESTAYSRKFKIYGKTTVKAIAFYDDCTPSEMAVAEYAKGLCSEPTVTPGGGTVFEHSGQEVSLAHDNPEGVLRYTIDGSDPTAESPEYTGPFTIDETTVVKAKVFGEQYFDSSIVTATLTRVWLKVATPEITAQAQFMGSKAKVELACDTEDALIRYTTNGADPNSHSTKYKGPFYVTNTTTVKAYATKADYTNSDIASFTITKVWGIGDTMGKPDHQFETGGDLGFVRVADSTISRGESMKSGTITDNQRSVLSTKLVGPGTLSFKWKASCEADDEFEWDHAEFRVNGELKGRINGVTDWIDVSQRIDGEGTNTVTWTYVKDDVEGAEQDCIWVADYVWESDYVTTQTTRAPVPYDWLTAKCPDVVDEFESYENEAKKPAANPRFTVEQCYVAGLEPNSPTDDFNAGIVFENDIPVLTWHPDLNEGGTKSIRSYKIWGSETLEGGGNWHTPTNAVDRFFKVTVEMP